MILFNGLKAKKAREILKGVSQASTNHEQEKILTELVKIGKPAIIPLIETIKDKSAIQQTALGRIGKPAYQPTLNALRKDETLAGNVSIVWGMIGYPIVYLLEELLNDKDHKVSQTAAIALGLFALNAFTMGHQRKVHSQERVLLIKRLQSQDKAVSKQAIKTIENIQYSEAVPILLKYSAGGKIDDEVRDLSFNALVQLGLKNPLAWKWLENCLGYEDLDVAVMAAKTIIILNGQVLLNADIVRKGLTKHLNSTDKEMPIMANLILGVFLKDNQSIPLLKQSLNSNRDDIQGAAALGLAELCNVSEAHSALEYFLKGKDLTTFSTPLLGYLAMAGLLESLPIKTSLSKLLNFK